MADALSCADDAVLPLGLAQRAIEMLSSRGQAVDRLLAGTTLFERDIDSAHARISARSMQALLENCARYWDAPDFAFELGMLARNTHTRHPLVDYLPHSTSRGVFMSLHGAFGESLERQWVEAAAVLLANSSTQHPKAFCFAFPEPQHFAQYDVFLMGKSRFGYPMAGVLLDRARSRHTDALSEPSSLIGSVRRRLHADRHPTLARVAADSGMSVASLKRRLAGHGTSFQRLLDEVMRSRAMVRMLIDRMSPTALGVEMGYADARSFRRSFRRWTGMTPVGFMQACDALQ